MTPEQMLIATCLAYPDAVTLTRGRADAEDFIDPRYQHLYTAILTEYAEAGTVNPITVHQRATTAGLRGVDLVDLYRWQEAISSAAVAPTLAGALEAACAILKEWGIAVRRREGVAEELLGHDIDDAAFERAAAAQVAE